MVCTFITSVDKTIILMSQLKKLITLKHPVCYDNFSCLANLTHFVSKQKERKKVVFDHIKFLKSNSLIF